MPSKEIWELNPATTNLNTDVIPRTQNASGDAEKLTLADAFFVGAIQPNETTKTDMTIQPANNTAGNGSDLILQVGQGTSNNDGKLIIKKPSTTATGQYIVDMKRGTSTIGFIDDNSVIVIGVNNIVPEPGTSNGSAIFGSNNSPQQQIVATTISGIQNTIGAEYSLIAGSYNNNDNTAFLTKSIVVGYNNYTADLTNVSAYIMGDSNKASTGPGQENAYIFGSYNATSGCGWTMGTNNYVGGNSDPCAYAFGNDNRAYDGGFAFGSNNIVYGEVGNSGSGAFIYGVDNEGVGTNTTIVGYNNTMGRYDDATLLSGNTFYLNTAGDFTTWFTGVGTKVALSYLNNKTTRTVEWLTFSNVTYNAGANRTEFDLTARSMTPNATSPAYQVAFSDTSESFIFGYGNNIDKSTSVSVLGRGIQSDGCTNCHFVGYAINRSNYSNRVFIGGDAQINLESTLYCHNETMWTNPRSTYTTSLTVDANGNLALSNSALNRSLVTINQTTNIDVNSITYFGPLNFVPDGQQFRLVNIGANNITLHKDNASGTSGYRLYWEKTGNTIQMDQNSSVSLVYVNNLPLTGSTGGWLVIPDGHA